jgi:hypothetical protein
LSKSIIICNLEVLFHDDLETKFVHHDIQIISML